MASFRFMALDKHICCIFIFTFLHVYLFTLLSLLQVSIVSFFM